jgi:hypothetical protein
MLPLEPDGLAMLGLLIGGSLAEAGERDDERDGGEAEGDECPSSS